MRMLVPLFLVAIGSPVTAQEVLDTARLQNIASKVSSFKPKDEFERPPALPSIDGKRFSFSFVPLRTGPDNRICIGSASWSYWPGDEKYEVGINEGTELVSNLKSFGRPMFKGFPKSDYLNSRLSFFSATCDHQDMPEYTLTNGFGAQFEVKSEREEVIAVGGIRSPYHEWKTYWDAAVVGDEGRYLSQNVQIRVSGMLNDWSEGVPVKCGERRKLPTIRWPYDNLLSICIFNGEPQLFEVIDKRTGQVLFSSVRK